MLHSTNEASPRRNDCPGASSWRVGALVVVVLLAACEGATPTPPGGAEVEELVLIPDVVTLAPGESAALTPIGVNGSGRRLSLPALTWSTASPGVAAVDSSGVVTAVDVGEAEISAATPAGVVGTARVVVGPHPAPVWREHACAVDVTGGIRCWGRGGNGELGDGSGRSSPQPVRVAGDVVWSQVAVGASHTCALDTGGRASCWGMGLDGQLGVASVARALVPVDVAGGRRFRAVSAGARHTCGITSDGLARCWGWNASGQVGNGTRVSQASPVLVDGAAAFGSVSAGGEHTCALTGDGRAFCWGNNAFGQVGDGTTTTRLSPTAVSTGLRFEEISAGARHTCGVAVGGAVHCWGDNSSAQFGNGTLSGSPVPVASTGGPPARAVSAGLGHSCMVGRDFPSVLCWGEGGLGQLGNGGNVLVGNPVLASPDSHGWVVAGAAHSCAVVTDGRLRCWGFGGFGQLGTGAYESSNVPVPVVGGVVYSADPDAQR